MTEPQPKPRVTESIARWVTLLIAAGAIFVAWIELNTIRQSSELAAAQAVMDTYYRARDGVVLAIERNYRDGMEKTLFQEKLERFPPQSSQLRSFGKAVVKRGDFLVSHRREQAETDYLNIVRQLCRLNKQELLGATAQSFLKEVAYKDGHMFAESKKEAARNEAARNEVELDKRYGLPDCKHLGETQ